MILNTANLSTLFQTYNAIFQKAFAGAESSWMKIATEITSTTESQLYAFLGQFPQMREWLGDRLLKNLAAFNYTLTNKDYESTVVVPRNKILDDVFGVFGPMFEEMGRTAKVHPDELLFALLAAGASTLCYDGQFFFDTDHNVTTNGVATSVANYDATGAGDLWVVADTSRAIKPLIFQRRAPYTFQSFNKPTDVNVFMRKEFIFGVETRVVPGFGLWQMAYGSLNTLNATNFDAIVTAMMALKSDEDKPLGIRPTILVVGPGNRAAARTLIDTQKLASGADNPNFKEVEVLVTPYLP